MKKMTIAILAVLLLGAVAFAFGFNGRSIGTGGLPEPVKEGPDGHVLTELWAQYSQAVAKDRPQLQAEILQKIKDEATRQRLHWDFYDAAQKYSEALVSRNWKMRDSARNQLAADIRAYNEPIVTFEYSRRQSQSKPQLLKLATESRAALSSGRNPAFYNNNSDVSGKMGKLLPEYIENDYQYALWALSTRPGTDDEYSRNVDKAILEVIGGKYPQEPYYEYLKAVSLYAAKDEYRKHKMLEDLASRYSGTAIALYPRESLLEMEFSSLGRGRRPSAEMSPKYKDLYARCGEFEKERAAMKGDEARIASACTGVVGLMRTLTGQDVSVGVSSDSVFVTYVNLPSAKVEIFRKDANKPFFKTDVPNTVGSFYAPDEEKIPFPVQDDGEYLVTASSGKSRDEFFYGRYSVSLAARRDARDLAVYAADSRSGKPVEKASLVLMKNGKKVCEVRDFKFDDGFTPVPKAVSSKMSDDSFYGLYVTFKDATGLVRRSQELMLSGSLEEYVSVGESVKERRVLTVLDRRAFNPGDTVCFKSVIYESDMINGASVVGQGKKVSVTLNDSKGNKIDSQELSTNSFGSVSGSFAIPTGLRNGDFSISFRMGGKFLSSESFRVDEFVLPTFVTTFERVDDLYLPGDQVTVKGHAASYSGHPLSSSRIHYTIEVNGILLDEGETVPSESGDFGISFTSPDTDTQYIVVNADVTDATGETASASTFLYIAREFPVSLEPVDAVSADLSLEVPRLDVNGKAGGKKQVNSLQVFRSTDASFVVRALNVHNDELDLPVEYTVFDASGETVASGSAKHAKPFTVDMSSLKPGYYMISASAKHPRVGSEGSPRSISLDFLLIPEDCDTLPVEALYYYRSLKTDVEAGEDMSFEFGSGKDPVWACVEIFGIRRELLHRDLVHIEGGTGIEGSLKTIAYEYQKEWPDAVLMQVFLFKNGEARTFISRYNKIRHNLDLPLKISALSESAYPGKEYTFNIKTLPDVECAVSVFDVATERIQPNNWEKVRLRSLFARSVHISSVTGFSGRIASNEELYESYAAAPMSASAGASLRYSKNAPMMLERAVAEENSMVYDSAEAAPEVEVRDNFAATASFQPQLRSDADGNVEVTFTTSEKLSTFAVSVLAHDKDMHNETIRKEIVVTLPVKLSVVQPEYLYKGDTYTLNAVVSSSSTEPVTGTASVYVYDGSDWKNLSPSAVLDTRLSVPAQGSVPFSFEIPVPGGDVMGMKVVFTSVDANGEEYSDAMFVKVPLKEASQVITEAHSAVFIDGMDKSALEESLRKAFVNGSAAGAEFREITLIDLIKEAVPDKVEPDGKDVVSLSEALYVRLLSEKLVKETGGAPVEGPAADELMKKVLACHNADGGFSWFEGMGSSPVITAVVLERFSKLYGASLIPSLPDVVPSAVRYLDNQQFGDSRPSWYGGLSDNQYIYIRSMFPDVKFDPSHTGRNSDFNKRLKDFKTYVKDYLVPSGNRGLQGDIFSKTRRVASLMYLIERDGGEALAQSWGIALASQKMKASLKEDIVSLQEYSVEHKDGGMYYPNAVMPYRGLLSGEAYAHSMIADLLSYEGSQKSLEIADGVRLWLMVQKETQHWDRTPAFVDAINTVMAGSESVKKTSILMMRKSFLLPLDKVKASGNGMKISRTVYKVTGSGYARLAPGQVLKRGDRVRVTYDIWNAENRSFVRLTAPREAALRPVNQLSGSYGWSVRSLRSGYGYSVLPQGYRNVRSDRTEYYFDVCPEEKSSVTEEFFVTQSGVFVCPAVEIECLYADEYRANGSFGGKLFAE